MENCNSNEEGYVILKVAKDPVDQVAVAEFQLKNPWLGCCLTLRINFKFATAIMLVKRVRREVQLMEMIANLST